jgi:hypothetical protein
MAAVMPSITVAMRAETIARPGGGRWVYLPEKLKPPGT